MVALLVGFGFLAHLGTVYFAGAEFVAIFLIYEQSLVSPDDLGRVNTAFFTLNGCVSLALFVFVAVDRCIF
jgi:4-hydroxybenzoate polyprenyltransferase